MTEINETAVDLKSDGRRKLSSISGNKCCLPHCGVSKRKVPNIKLFRFPYLEATLLKAWLEKCNLDESFLEKSRILYICDRHFSPFFIGKKYLKKGALPTLNLTDKTVVIGKEKDSYSERRDVDLTPYETPHNCLERNEVDLTPNETPHNCLKRKNGDLTSSRLKALESPTTLCTNCHQTLKTQGLNEKKFSNTFKKLKALRQEKINLKKKIRSLTKRLQTLETKVKNKKSIEAEVDNLDINANEKTFCKMLIKKNRTTNARWDDQETSLAQSIFNKSSSAYRFLRNILKLNLPHPSSLRRWKDHKNKNVQ